MDEDSGFELKVSLPPMIYINWEADRLCLTPHLNLIPGVVQNELGGSGRSSAEYLVQLCRDNNARFVALGIDTTMGLYPILANQALWKIAGMVPSLKEFVLFEVRKRNLQTAIQERWEMDFFRRVPQHMATRDEIQLGWKEENLESMVRDVLHYHGHFDSVLGPLGWEVKPVRPNMDALLNWLKVMSLKNVRFTDRDGWVKLSGL